MAASVIMTTSMMQEMFMIDPKIQDLVTRIMQLSYDIYNQRVGEDIKMFPIRRSSHSESKFFEHKPRKERAKWLMDN